MPRETPNSYRSGWSGEPARMTARRSVHRATPSVGPTPRLASLNVATRDTSRVAAHMLKGRELPGGWRVIEKIERDPDATGGHFSVGYIVERNGSRGYLKALDYTLAFESRRLSTGHGVDDQCVQLRGRPARNL